MIFILRGHIRESFETKQLYNLVKELYIIFPDIKIFIHTWNIFANNMSWKIRTINKQNVNDKIIYDYFDDLKHLIKHIIIDDDSKIHLIGNLCGSIYEGSLLPIIGWKNYWYGKHKIINYLYNINIDDNEIIVNCRFDVMNNSNSLDHECIVNFIKNNSKIIFTKNIFLFNYECTGIDNIYIGNINTLCKLINTFFYELDDILIKNKDTLHQEMLVYKINNILFD